MFRIRLTIWHLCHCSADPIQQVVECISSPGTCATVLQIQYNKWWSVYPHLALVPLFCRSNTTSGGVYILTWPCATVLQIQYNTWWSVYPHLALCHCSADPIQQVVECISSPGLVSLFCNLSMWWMHIIVDWGDGCTIFVECGGGCTIFVECGGGCTIFVECGGGCTIFVEYGGG
ncbi:hypothetical protein J6590_053899 [Homalodisca vitripennis]|nr:hypothetical protein J6590_053899 [Homalodisca vitripennis]